MLVVLRGYKNILLRLFGRIFMIVEVLLAKIDTR